MKNIKRTMMVIIASVVLLCTPSAVRAGIPIDGSTEEALLDVLFVGSLMILNPDGRKVTATMTATLDATEPELLPTGDVHMSGNILADTPGFHIQQFVSADQVVSATLFPNRILYFLEGGTARQHLTNPETGFKRRRKGPTTEVRVVIFLDETTGQPIRARVTYEAKDDKTKEPFSGFLGAAFPTEGTRLTVF